MHAADTAQGWVVASSEIHARTLLGDFSFVQHMPLYLDNGIPIGTVLVTDGSLAKQRTEGDICGAPIS